MNSKTELRTIAKEIRKNLKLDGISQKIVENIKTSAIYQSAKNIMLFYPTKYEINLISLTKDTVKNFYLPRVKDELLEVCPYKSGDKLVKSELNIYEPQTKSVDKNILDLVIIPALMVDKKGYRLGYGGGYYDRFLKDLSSHKAVVVANKLLTDNLPVDNYDIKCDFIFTD